MAEKYVDPIRGTLLPTSQLMVTFPFFPSDDDREWAVDRLNRHNPFCDFVGNDRAVYRLCQAAFVALGRTNHLCNDNNFALIGPPSTGKATMARHFAGLVQLPFVCIEPLTINTPLDLLLRIAKVCQDWIIDSGRGDGTTTSLELIPLAENQNHLVLPPMVVFVDGVHDLKPEVVQGLLRASDTV